MGDSVAVGRSIQRECGEGRVRSGICFSVGTNRRIG
jgi:hypothetical protein